MYELVRALVLAALAQSAPPQLVDQTGHAFTLGSLLGRPTVVTFVSAHCTDACPLVNAQFALAARTIARRRIVATLLTVTLDPQRDSAADMRKMAREFAADPRYWKIADGSVENVRRVMERFGVVAVRAESGYREAHSTFVYVLDGKGAQVETMLASSGLAGDIVNAVR